MQPPVTGDKCQQAQTATDQQKANGRPIFGRLGGDLIIGGVHCRLSTQKKMPEPIKT